MNLTKREQDVYNKVVNNIEGKSQKELAVDLSMSIGTFHTHLLNIFFKTNTNSQIELIVRHYKRGKNENNINK
jgi:DNA-binding CsgD family transcriptional regulator